MMVIRKRTTGLIVATLEDIESLCDVTYEIDGGRVRQELFYGAKQLKKIFLIFFQKSETFCPADDIYIWEGNSGQDIWS
jgi:hypothetical protein